MRILLLIFLLSIISVSSAAQTVYKTPSGAKYHLGNCRTVKNVSEEISIEKAIESGLQPCKVCKPPVVYTAPGPQNKPQGQNQTVQCSGKTKAGTRCKHMTRIANGYCFEHQPG